MRRYLIFIGIAVMCLSTAGECRKAMDYDYPLYLNNQSDRRIQLWTPNAGEVGYPDTNLHELPRGVIVHPNKKLDVAGGGISWEKIYKSERRDTLSFFLFDVDTLEKYSWDIVKKNYMVLQRYDLSIYDLQKLNYTLYYPPTEAMRDMKMWPRYGE